MKNLDGNPITWTYDGLYRLTGQAKAGQACTYTLDGVWNLRSMWEGGSFPRTFAFNAADRLVTMVEGANLTTYDGDGLRRSFTDISLDPSVFTYVWDGTDYLCEVSDV